MTTESEAAMSPGKNSSTVEEATLIQPESSAEFISTPEKVVSVWEKVVQNPDEWLINLLENEVDQRIAFVAGGGLPLLFGAENGLWNDIQLSLQNETITIAGIDFTAAELASLGRFYRFMNGAGISLHCIDERCIDDTNHAGIQVHEHCGACAAVAAAIEARIGKKIDVETFVYEHLPNDGQNEKQPIHPEMQEAHASMVVLVDLSGADVVKSDARNALRKYDALPFNVSLPLDMIQNYIDLFVMPKEEREVEIEQLITALVKWNVQIACNIIGDHHNELREHAEEMRIVVDVRETDGPVKDLKKRFLETPLMMNSQKLFITDDHSAA
jgi:hypothetical protein